MSAKWSLIALAAMVLFAGIACDARGRENTSAKAAIPKEEEHANQGDAAKDAPGGTRYKVNPAKSRLTAQVGVGGMLKGLGHAHLIAFKEFHGELETAPRFVGPAVLRLSFKTGSALETGKEFDEKDRQKVNAAVHGEALETGKFPEASFKSPKVEVKASGEHQLTASISGDLTLHGVTHEVSFPAKVRVEGKSLHAEGAFMLLHSAYGIKRLSAAGGTIKAKDEIQVSFDIQADAE